MWRMGSISAVIGCLTIQMDRMMARVRPVTREDISSAEMVKVTGSIFAKTGVAPIHAY
jgi:hypothetical protein